MKCLTEKCDNQEDKYNLIYTENNETYTYCERCIIFKLNNFLFRNKSDDDDKEMGITLKHFVSPDYKECNDFNCEFCNLVKDKN